MNEKCPCDAVSELKKIVSSHDKQLGHDATRFAEIQKDLQYIKENIDRKNKINISAVTAVIQAVCTLIVTIIAARM